MESNNQPTTSKKVLQHALHIARPLVRWLLRSGVGYSEFMLELKTVFLHEAEAELKRVGGKRNDSTRSMLSGLHRKDVRALLPMVEAELSDGSLRAEALRSRASLASKVVTRWLNDELAESIAITGAAPSFESLLKSVTQDVHPRAVLLEMQRLGLVEERDGQVHLLRSAFVPNAQLDEVSQMVASSVSDHLAAAVSNISNAQQDGAAKSAIAPATRPDFLEQSVFADGLSVESAREIEKLAASLWPKVMKTLIQAATPLCEQDEPRGGDQRVRIGMYSYSEAMHHHSNAEISNNTSPAEKQK